MENYLFKQLSKDAPKQRVKLILSFGLIICGALFLFIEFDFNNHAIITTVKIIEFSEYGLPIVSNVVDGEEYIMRLSSKISNVSVGAKIQAKYHSRNPGNIQCGEYPFHNSGISLLVLGSLSALVSGGVMYYNRKQGAGSSA